MPYSELIKNFSGIRDYMRDFYIYGFKRRGEYNAKSARSYDNERRRIESWLGGHMSFRQDCNGKNVYISIDSRGITRNPLYKAFKARSFTARDIMLHFFILDALYEGSAYTTSEITDKLEREYLSEFEEPTALDESTVRLKLREYETLGLLFSQKKGKQRYYGINLDNVCLTKWEDALAFYSEEDPLGVVGSFLLDKLEKAPELFQFKHHFILHALESEILYELLRAIDEKRRVEIDIFNPRRGKPSTHTLVPLKILVSTQGGRRYLLAYAPAALHMKLFRLDTIRSVIPRDTDKEYIMRQKQAAKFMKNLWGVSSGDDASLDHIEMTIRVDPGEDHIPARLEREKRCGIVEAIGKGLYRFTADVYDAGEMLPWFRTFIGRIVSLECSNISVRQIFLSDLQAMENLYTGGN